MEVFVEKHVKLYLKYICPHSIWDLGFVCNIMFSWCESFGYVCL